MCQFLPDSYGFMYGLIQLIRLKTEHPKIQEVHNFVTLLFQCLVALLGGIALLDVWNVTCDTDTFHVCVVSFGGGGGGGHGSKGVFAPKGVIVVVAVILFMVLIYGGGGGGGGAWTYACVGSDC